MAMAHDYRVMRADRGFMCMVRNPTNTLDVTELPPSPFPAQSYFPSRLNWNRSLDRLLVTLYTDMWSDTELSLCQCASVTPHGWLTLPMPSTTSLFTHHAFSLLLERDRSARSPTHRHVRALALQASSPHLPLCRPGGQTLRIQGSPCRSYR